MPESAFVSVARSQIGWARWSIGGHPAAVTLAFCGHPYTAFLLVLIAMLLRTVVALAFSPLALEVAKSRRHSKHRHRRPSRRK
jgi:hypothetical protein